MVLRYSRCVPIAFGLLCSLCSPLAAVAQYSAPATVGQLFPRPAGGVVLVPTPFPGQGPLEVFDADGRLDPVTATRRVGTGGDITDGLLVGDRLVLATGGQFVIDYIVPLPAAGVYLDTRDSLRALFRSRPEPATASLEAYATFVGSTPEGFAAFANADSLYVVDSLGAVQRRGGLPPKQDVLGVADLAGLPLARSTRVFVGRDSQTETRVIDRDAFGGTIGDTLYRRLFLREYTDSANAYAFFPDGYLTVSDDSVRAYAEDMVLTKVFDAGNRAVGLDEAGQLFGWRGDGRWERLSDERFPTLSAIVRRPEGWYTLNGDILSFDPARPLAPLVNPLRLRLTADDARAVVRSDAGSARVWDVVLSGNLTVVNTNTTDTVRGAVIRLLGPPEAYDPLDPFGQAARLQLEPLAPGASVRLPISFTYPYLDPDPPTLALMSACLIDIGQRSVQAGEQLCSSASTARVVGVSEHTADDGLEVYPNPSSGALQVSSRAPFATTEVFDLTGRRVYLASYSAATQATLDVTHLPSGVYLLALTTEHGGRNVARFTKH